MTRNFFQVFRREFLDSRNDNSGAFRDCSFELFRRTINTFYDASRLFKLRNSFLKLAIKNNPVGDDDGRIKNGVILWRVQICLLYTSPSPRD